MLPLQTVLNDRYRLIETIGEGGMAMVYRALDTRLARTVAIKVLHPEYARDRPFLERFQQEAEFAASLGAHPNIVQIYDVGEDGDIHYIVMELVEGRNLKQLIRERAPFTPEEAFAIGQQVASALDFAHHRGLVHRDIKPQNIVVSDQGIAKVTDFGIAHSISASELTRTGMVIGTVHYFSPEQAQGKPAGPATDIYALGIILYEMLTAHLPFDAENPIGIAMQHLHNEPPPLQDYNPKIPTQASRIVLRALEKDPERRYRDAAEFAGAMAGYTAPAPDTGRTTQFSPIVEPPRQRTRVYRTAEPPPTRRTVVREARPVTPPATTVVEPPSNPWRTLGIVLGALVVAGLIAGTAFLLTSRAFQGTTGTATATPTATATSTPTPTPTKKKHRHTPTPTSAPAATVPLFVPTDTPVPLPTWTPTIPPPSPTPKPVPPTPRPKPTAIPPTIAPPTPTVVEITPTVELIGPTDTPVPNG